MLVDLLGAPAAGQPSRPPSYAKFRSTDGCRRLVTGWSRVDCNTSAHRFGNIRRRATRRLCGPSDCGFLPLHAAGRKGDEHDMRVIHVSPTDTDGGAAKGSYKLHKTLEASGVDSLM